MIKVNSDNDLVAEIKRQLKENGGYCPCSITKNEDTKCPCKAFREMKSGICHCGLYIKTEDNKCSASV